MTKALYLLLFVSSTALADDAAILKCRSLGDTASRLGCYDAIPVGAVAAAPAIARAPAANTAEQRFGLKTPAAAPESIESTTAGAFDGWAPEAPDIKLANGQVWRVTDGSTAALARTSNRKVKIVRGMMGGLYLEIDGVGNSPRVRRVR